MLSLRYATNINKLINMHFILPIKISNISLKIKFDMIEK